MTEKQNPAGTILSDNKLYLIVTFFVLTVLGLLSLSFLSVQIQATVRAFVGAESLWSKSQKDAFYSLTRYIQTQSEKDFEKYLSEMEVVKGDWNSWIELNQPNPDLKKAYQGMFTGRNHPDDIPLMIENYLRFHRFPNFEKADEVMKEQGPVLQRADQLSEEIHREIRSGKSDEEKMKQRMIQLERLNSEGSRLEAEFSSVLGDAARWTNGILFGGILSIGGSLIFVGVIVAFRWGRQIQMGERSLRDSENRLQMATTQLPSVLWTTDKSLIFTSSMGAGLSKMNLQQNQVVGTSLWDFFQTRDPENRSIVAHRQALNGNSSTYETEWAGRVFQSCVEPFFDKSRNIIGTIGVATDITEMKRATDALEEEKERLNVTLRSIGDGVITTDTQGKVILINPVAESLVGWTQQEVYKRPLAEVFHIINEKTRLQCENPVTKVLAEGEIVTLANHTILITRDGRERSIADSGAPIRDRKGDIIGVVLVFRDVTEKQKIEEEQIKSMKLESIGLLAGGIAHDFNNILTAILGNVSLAKMELNPGTSLFEWMEETEKASLRAKDLASQLLTFAKGGAPVRRIIPIEALLRESASFALRGSNVRAELDFAPLLWEVEIDEGQMTQVFHNLVINAQHAMPEGGSLSIRTENVSIDKDEAKRLSVKPGQYVQISVKDTGTGIPKEYLNKIFDPYFTTKEKGSGLGLSTSYSIIRKHDGAISVSSEVGAGTTFIIYLPSKTGENPYKSHRN
jgi:PAS domain S-box-containing protein